MKVVIREQSRKLALSHLKVPGDQSSSSALASLTPPLTLLLLIQQFGSPLLQHPLLQEVPSSTK